MSDDTKYQLKLDGNNILVGKCISDISQPGFILVSIDIYNDPNCQVGRCTVVSGVITVYTPTSTVTTQLISKADIWRRATDDEAVKMIALLDTETPRMQRIFNDASYILTTDEFYPILLAGLTNLFSADRAAALLAPS